MGSVKKKDEMARTLAAFPFMSLYIQARSKCPDFTALKRRRPGKASSGKACSNPQISNVLKWPGVQISLDISHNLKEYVSDSITGMNTNVHPNKKRETCDVMVHR